MMAPPNLCGAPQLMEENKNEFNNKKLLKERQNPNEEEDFFTNKGT